MTLLLPAEQIEVLEEFAAVDGMSVTEAIQLSTSVSWSVPCNYDPSRCRRFTNRTQRRFAVDPVRLYGMQYGMGDTGTWRVNRPLGTLRIASVRFDGWPGPSSRPKYVASDVRPLGAVQNAGTGARHHWSTVRRNTEHDAGLSQARRWLAADRRRSGRAVPRGGLGAEPPSEPEGDSHR